MILCSFAKFAKIKTSQKFLLIQYHEFHQFAADIPCKIYAQITMGQDSVQHKPIVGFNANFTMIGPYAQKS